MNALERANDSVARRFSRHMRASSSAWGMWSDPPLVASAMVICATVAALLRQLAFPSYPLRIVFFGGLVPAVGAVVVSLTIIRARSNVVKWLAGVPFPVDNMNALLNGVGQNLSVHFAGEVPDRDTINEAVEQIHPDCFALEYGEEEPTVQVRIGVLDSKLNPARSNFRRFQRVQRLVGEALVPLAEKFPITGIWIC